MTLLAAFFSFLPSANAAPDTNREATAVARTAFFIDMDFLQESGLRTQVRSAGDFVTCVTFETQETSRGATLQACLVRRRTSCDGSTRSHLCSSCPTPGTARAP